MTIEGYYFFTSYQRFNPTPRNREGVLNMQMIKKIPPANQALSDALILGGWKKLKEPPSLFLTILFSLPFMFLNAVLFITFASILYEPLKLFLKSVQAPSISVTINGFIVFYVAGVFGFMALHELAHACFIPRGLKSDKTSLGLNGLFAFVYTTEEITKGRFFIISIMPFFILSTLLPSVLSLFGLLSEYWITLCLINAMGSSVDCFNMCLVSFQVPKGSYIVSNGSETYFK